MGRYDFPDHLEFDTQNACNLKCIFCYQHSTFDKCDRMPLHMVERLVSQIQGHKMQSIRPFMNGEVMFEMRLPEIIKIIRKYNASPIDIFTNGTVYPNRHLLVTPELHDIHITFCAATAKTYTLVHGKPLFKQTMKTIQWLRTHKAPETTLIIHFVITKQNLQELDAWKRLFTDYQQIVSPLHKNERDKAFMENIWPGDLSHLGTLKGNLFGMPCHIWNNFPVTATGDYILCCDAGVDLTYGNVMTTSLLDAWKARCANKMQNKYCLTCNCRAKNWKELVDAA